ncbi:MAG: hypothetical protein Q8P83_04225 [bacterium]|nr:hypothetical protein [bacterium]
MSEKRSLNLESSPSINPEKNQRLVSLFIESARKMLLDVLGIENLSVIEGVRLRKIVERSVADYNKQNELVSKGEMKSWNVINPGPESAFWWLDVLYDVRPEFLPGNIVIEDLSDSKKHVFNSLGVAERQKAEELKLKLEEQGHRVVETMVFSDEAKEYVRRKRAQAHKPELD